MLAPLETHERDALHGPAMLALNERQRAFVVALYQVPQNRNTRINAARLAGYGTAMSNNKSLGVIAGRLIHDERIQAAIEEHGRAQMPALYPLAISSLRDLLHDKTHKGHERAVMGVIEKMAPIELHHLHQHEHRHRVDHDAEAVDALRFLKQMGMPQEGLIRMFGVNGLPRYEAMLAKQSGVKVVESSATEVVKTEII